MSNLKHLIANMRKAAFNRQEVSIAGGIFEAPELEAAANALEAQAELLEACEAIIEALPGSQLGDAVGENTATSIRTAIRKAKGQ